MHVKFSLHAVMHAVVFGPWEAFLAGSTYDYVAVCLLTPSWFCGTLRTSAIKFRL